MRRGETFVEKMSRVNMRQMMNSSECRIVNTQKFIIRCSMSSMERMAKLEQSAQPTVLPLNQGKRHNFSRKTRMKLWFPTVRFYQKTVKHCGVLTQGLTTVKEEPLLDGTLIAEASSSPISYIEICHHKNIGW